MAENTIRDLELNVFHHVKRRIQWIALVSITFKALTPKDPRRIHLIKEITSRNCALSSFTRAYLSAVGQKY